MVNLQTRLGQSDEVLSRELGDSLIVLNTATGRYFRLDRPGAAIWHAIETPGRAAAMIAALAEQYDCPIGALEPDVLAFIEMAAANGLLEIDADRDSAPGPAASEAPTLQMSRSALQVRGPLEPLRADFERQHYARLPQLIEPGLLQVLARMVEAGEWADRTHDGIGTELCLVPGIATSALQLLFNDPKLLEIVAGIAGCDRVGCFDGRAYRMSAGAGHYDSWHSDVGEDRLVAVSVNFSPEPYDGGALEIGRASSQEILHDVPNGDFGSAVMFAVSPALRHRVNAVRGSRPRTAYAGWFRSSPEFQDLFFASLPKD